MANVADICELLERVQSPDDAVRNEAERLLKQMEVDDYSLFLLGLCAAFATDDKPLHIQRLAVIIFKNTLDSKEQETKRAQLMRWVELDSMIKSHIRTEILKALHHPAVDLAKTVSMLIAKVAASDLCRGEWPDLIPSLLNNMTMEPARSSVRQATLESLGYICEELAAISSFDMNQDFVNTILTAVVRGMVKEEADDNVRLAATQALTNALEFAQTNFNNEEERTYIMRVVCEGIVCPTSEEVRIASYECLVQICQNYYEHLPPYMSEIFKLTLHSIQSDEESVAKQAVELWCTLCEEELDLQDEIQNAILEETVVLHNLVKQCYKTLVPVLLTQLSKQDEDQELDELSWTLAMAAGACLELVAVTIGNLIVPLILDYCMHYLEVTGTPDSWRYREAATFALGSIMEGANSQDLMLYVQGNFERLLAATRDTHPFVRNTTAWTLGRTFEYLAFRNNCLPILNQSNLDKVVETLTAALADEPHIANRVCFALSKLAQSMELSEALSLGVHFVTVIQALINVAFKPVEDRAMKIRLQVSAFDAINGMVRDSPDNCIENVLHMVPLLVTKLKETLQSDLPPEELQRISDLQGMLCGCLGVVLRRLESDNAEFGIDLNAADVTMEILLSLFQTKHVTVHEEAMMAVGSMTFALKTQFSRYMAQFMPFLDIGLRNHQEIQVCISTIGTLSNICQAVSESISPYCDPIMEVLISKLQSSEVNRDIKPHILSSFSDIAMAMGSPFAKYLGVVASILKSAIELSIAEGGAIDEDFAEYNNDLRKAILEAYSGILQGIGRVEAEKCLHQESQFMIDFLERVVSEAPRDEKILCAAVGVLGDIAQALPSLNSFMKQKEWIDRFVKDCTRSTVVSIRDTAKWAATSIATAAATTATSA